ncbi:MAG TPA: methionyl-tRNA formyltransferase [bacterium]|nr:methionyl-tRNA formyltransferase [bacterium]
MRVVFLGSQEIGAACLEVILKQGHDVVGVGTFEPASHEQWKDDVARIARARSLPMLRARRFKTKDAIEELKAARPDILFAIGWRWILPAEVLAIPPQGCLGIHGSLLPRLRGFAPVNWALIRDERETGPSLFYFDEGMDTGDIVGQRPFAIAEDDDAATIRARVAKEGVALLEEMLPRLADGTAPRRQQDHSQATYGEQRRPEDGRIDWTWEPRRVFNFVRGLTRPYPGAWTEFDGSVVKIWKVRVAEGKGKGPGTVESRDPRGLPRRMGAGSGTIEILDSE